MKKAELLALIESASSLVSIVSFFETQVLTPIPWIFKGQAQDFENWRQDVCTEIGVTKDAIYLVGSAATGYSLSPIKPGRPFKPVSSTVEHPSDIDIVIVDQVLFLEGWDRIVTSDRKLRLRHEMPNTNTQISVKDQINRLRLDIYFGAISNKYVFPGTQVSQRLRALLSATTRRTPFLAFSGPT